METQEKKFIQLSLFNNNIEVMTEKELDDVVTSLYQNCIKSYNHYRGYRDVTDMTVYLSDNQIKNIDFIIKCYEKLYTVYRWCWSCRFNFDETQKTLKIYIDRDTE